MARLSPGIDLLRRDGGLYRELDVLERLRKSLPDGHEIFHSLTWHGIHEGQDRHGEIDLVVLAPSGCILLIEVKAGSVDVREGSLFKCYGGASDERDVGRQIRIQYAAMRGRLHSAGLHAALTNCLVLPDHRLHPGDHLVAIPRERIIDASEFEQLGPRVRDMLAMGGMSRASRSDTETLSRFLANEFRVIPDTQTLGAQLRQSQQRLADGLATWVPRISAPSGVFLIEATAGSGKTQLALRLLQDAAQQKQRALYVCYNRPLSAHIARLAPVQAQVATYHELCVEHHRQQHGGAAPDFTETGIFERLAQAYGEAAASLPARYGLIVIDEGQDFEPEWVASLLPQLQADGRLYLMQDEAQQLYDRESFDLPDAVIIRSRDNFRSPRAICQTIDALRLTATPIEARSPYVGELPGIHAYTSEAALQRQTIDAVHRLLERGIPLADIALISGKGHRNSTLLKRESLGDWRLRRFTSRYDRDGEQIWSEGELLAESITRFKGQSASGIVLTEYDFEQLDTPSRRRLFVGLTRAQLAVEMVLSESAEKALALALTDAP